MCLGIPAKVIELYEKDGMKTIVHVGFGLSILDEQEALETMELLKQIDVMGEN
ncbi:MAG: HypC/HybG/HupF family hydrogenase formation chaperone [Chloroflexi bacterium]|nr:HypC/HybG/HupF family hydrogenase formation chaperone [Chloroflexota bacterium]